MLRPLLTSLAGLLAVGAFAAAALLSSTPSVPRSESPSADSVRRARGAAVELAMALTADGMPRRVQFSRRDLEASATLVAHGFDWLRVRPSIEADAFVSQSSVRIADRTWINFAGRVAPGASAFPDVTLRIGAWRFPPMVVRGGLRAADRFARWRGHELPPATSMLRDVAVGGDAVAATLAVPKQLFRFARALVGSTRPAVDPLLLGSVYQRLVAARLPANAPLADILRPAFAGRPADVAAIDYNRAAFIALAMYAVSPAAQRLAGSDVDLGITAAALPVQLSGRVDLARHFTLSAALAATLDPRFTRAMSLTTACRVAAASRSST